MKNAGGFASFDDDQFDLIFPRTFLEDDQRLKASSNHCNKFDRIARENVGLIESQINGVLSTGTGTLIYNDEDYVIGLTAKHCFFENNYFIDSARFLQGSVEVGNGLVNHLAEINILEVWTDNKLPAQDVAVFVGRYTHIIDRTRRSQYDISKVVETELKEGEEACNFILHHYPYGVYDQRVNYGDVSFYQNAGRHQVSSLPGSSGAAVFDEDYNIVGIHVRGGSAINAQPSSAQYVGNRFGNIQESFIIAQFNEFNIISKKSLKKFKSCYTTPAHDETTVFRRNYIGDRSCSDSCCIIF